MTAGQDLTFGMIGDRLSDLIAECMEIGPRPEQLAMLARLVDIRVEADEQAIGVQPVQTVLERAWNVRKRDPESKRGSGEKAQPGKQKGIG